MLNPSSPEIVARRSTIYAARAFPEPPTKQSSLPEGLSCHVTDTGDERDLPPFTGQHYMSTSSIAPTESGMSLVVERHTSLSPTTSLQRLSLAPSSIGRTSPARNVSFCSPTVPSRVSLSNGVEGARNLSFQPSMCDAIGDHSEQLIGTMIAARKTSEAGGKILRTHTTARRPSTNSTAVTPALTTGIRQRATSTSQSAQWYDVLGPQLLDGANVIPTSSVIESVNFTALYFAALWCPPCMEFTPVLKRSYNYLKKQGLEVIFVSSDKTDTKFRKHYSEMPWKAVQWRDDMYKIGEYFSVFGVPKVAVLHPDGTVATQYGAELLRNDLTGNKLMEAVLENTIEVEEDDVQEEEMCSRIRKRDKIKEQCAVM